MIVSISLLCIAAADFIDIVIICRFDNTLCVQYNTYKSLSLLIACAIFMFKMTTDISMNENEKKWNIFFFNLKLSYENNAIIYYVFLSNTITIIDFKSIQSYK